MIFGSRFLIPSSGYGRDCRISSCVIEGRLQGPGGSPSVRGFWLPQWAFYMPGFLNIRFLTIYQISLSAIFSGFFSQVKSMNLQRLFAVRKYSKANADSITFLCTTDFDPSCHYSFT